MRTILFILFLPLRLFWRLTMPRSFPHGKPFNMRDPLVIDGDSLWHEGRRIRIWGIDAPEIDQPGGQAAKAQLARLCRMRRIHVVPRDTDVYGRIVAQLYYGRGDIGQQMVASGYALARTRRYSRDERRAKRRPTGLWDGGCIEDPAGHRRRAAGKARA